MILGLLLQEKGKIKTLRALLIISAILFIGGLLILI